MSQNSRLEELLREISELKSENASLKKMLTDHGITYQEQYPGTHDPDQGGRILPYSITPELANRFFSYFWGRMDVYSLRVVSKSGKVGYYPQCNNFWHDGCLKKYGANKEGKRGSLCMDCNFRSWRPITPEVIIKHLNGQNIIGVYPMSEQENCRFLVFDFDNHSASSTQDDFANTDETWKQEVDAVRQICKINKIDPLVERSRSGRGAHLWIFFDKPVSAEIARRFGEVLLRKGAESVNLKSFRYYDRMIPAQDHLQPGGLGNLIALPLQPEALAYGNSAFIDENWNAFPDQFKELLSKPKLSLNQISQFIEKWEGEHPLADGVDEGKTSGINRPKPWLRSEKFFRGDVKGQIHVTLSNLIYIDTINLEPRIQNQIRRLAAFSNPVFYKNQAMNLSNFQNSRYIYLGEDIDGYIAVPRGLLEPITERFTEAKIPFEIDDQRMCGKKLHVEFNGNLKENQKEAVENLIKHDNGILSAATAFGKTVVCCDLITERKVSVLILLESSSLISQWQSSIKRFVSINEELPQYKTKTGRIRTRKELVGVLHGAKDTTTGIIDIAMVGSVFGKDGPHLNLENYGMIIVDECHHAASETIQKILRETKAKYVYGVTATPIREDGLEKINFMLIGPIRFKFTAKERAREQGIEHLVIPRFTRTVCPRDSKPEINEAYELVRDSKSRNEQIIEDTRKCIDEKRTPVILTRYTEHARLLYNRMEGFADHTFLLLGSKSLKEKRKIYQKLNEIPEKETILLVATGKLVGEGFDCPRLDTLIMATPVAGKSVVEQYTGRLNRDYTGKRDVIVYDYIDSHIPVFDRMYGKRMRAYKQIGYHILQNESDVKTKEQDFIFDVDTYAEPFHRDIVNAEKEIIISSPGLRAGKVNEIISLLEPVQRRGVRVIILTWKMDFDRYGSSEARAYLLEELRRAGFDLRLLEDLTEHFAVIDKNILWYGSMNFLGKEDAEDNLMRIVNSKAAEELLELTLKNEK